MTANNHPMQNGVGSSLAAEAEEVYRQRQQVEERMEALASFLTSDGMPGLDGPLVDEEGFPRADIDVHAVRDARHRLACLKTDYRELQRRLEDILLRIHENTATRNAETDQQNMNSNFHHQTNGITNHRENAVPIQEEEEPPQLLEEEGPAFAEVDVVHPGSPSSTAGIVVGDRVLRLGSLHLTPSIRQYEGNSEGGGGSNGASTCSSSHTRPLSVQQIFQSLPGEVAQHENSRIPVIVQRGCRILSLWLVPRRWEGRGLLGCHLKPL